MSRYADRIADLDRRAGRDRESFVPPTDPPAEREAKGYLRSGFGECVAVYLDARTGGPPVRFEADEFDRLEAAMNTWLSLYARCYGVSLDADYTVRVAAEVLLDTHDVAATAAVLTHVPDREGGSATESPSTPADSSAGTR